VGSRVSDFYDEPDEPEAAILGPIFTATYETDCESCDDPIVPGEDARANGVGSWIHADDQCEAIATALRSTRTPSRQIPCSRCFTYHAGECL
jgi:hypothetical protein